MAARMMPRPIWTLPLPRVVTDKLRSQGFEYCEMLIKQDPSGNTKYEDINKHLSVPKSKTAFELAVEELEGGAIFTFSKAIDELFDGGIPVGKITEVVGAPGSGKTQLCLQLCASVQVPEYMGGLGGRAVFIETNCGYSHKRFEEIVTSVIVHCENVTKSLKVSPENLTSLMTMKKTGLNGVQRYSVNDVSQLRACIFHLQKRLELEKEYNLKLIVIDSFVFPFHFIESSLQRTKLVSIVINHLYRLASAHSLAVVVTNELTTTVVADKCNEIAPCLGENFAHLVNNRLVLAHMPHLQYYSALLEKSPDCPQQIANFQILKQGIRDISTY